MSSSPSRWRCLLGVLCPVRKPVTTLDWVLLKDKNLALAPRQGPEISSRACLRISPRPRHRTQCSLINQGIILLRISCLETPTAGSGPRNPRTQPPLASSSAISLPRPPARPGTQYSLTACRVEISFNTFWHCWTNEKPLTAAENGTKSYIHGRGGGWLYWHSSCFLQFRYTNKEACLQTNNSSSKSLHILKEIMLTSQSKPCIFHGCNWRTGIGSAQPEGFAPPLLYGCNSDGPELAAHSPKVLHRQYCTAVTLTDQKR